MTSTHIMHSKRKGVSTIGDPEIHWDTVHVGNTDDACNEAGRYHLHRESPRETDKRPRARFRRPGRERFSRERYISELKVRITNRGVVAVRIVRV